MLGVAEAEGAASSGSIPAVGHQAQLRVNPGNVLRVRAALLAESDRLRAAVRNVRNPPDLVGLYGFSRSGPGLQPPNRSGCRAVPPARRPARRGGRTAGTHHTWLRTYRGLNRRFLPVEISRPVVVKLELFVSARPLRDHRTPAGAAGTGPSVGGPASPRPCCLGTRFGPWVIGFHSTVAGHFLQLRRSGPTGVSVTVCPVDAAG